MELTMWVQRTEDGYVIYMKMAPFERESDALLQGEEILSFIEGRNDETIH